MPDTSPSDPSAVNKLMNLPASQLAWVGPDMLLTDDVVRFMHVEPGVSPEDQSRFFWRILASFPTIDALMFCPSTRTVLHAKPSPIQPTDF